MKEEIESCSEGKNKKIDEKGKCRMENSERGMEKNKKRRKI